MIHSDDGATILDPDYDIDYERWMDSEPQEPYDDAPAPEEYRAHGQCALFRPIVAIKRNGEITAATEVRCLNSATAYSIVVDNATGQSELISVCGGHSF